MTNPRAIWERPALWTHRKSTTGFAVEVLTLNPGEGLESLAG
jgi:hypothetical protein